MFYHPVLLSPQHQMGLFLPWLAATRGIKEVPKDKISSADLIKLCKHILRFIESNSPDPKKRFSLRLAVMLVHGIVLVFRAKVEQLEARISSSAIEKRIEHIRYLESLSGLNSDNKKEKNVKEKKKRVPKNIVHTPSSWEEIGAVNLRDAEKNVELTKVQARVEDITLREEPPKSKDQPQFDDLGCFLMDIDANTENVTNVNPKMIVTEVEVHQEDRDAPRGEVTEAVSSVAVPELPAEEEIQYVIQPLEIDGEPVPVPASTAPPEQMMDEIQVVPEVPAQEPAKEVQQEPVGERETTIDDEEQFLVPQQVAPKTRPAKSIYNKLLYIQKSGRRRRNNIFEHQQEALNDADILDDIARFALLLPDCEKIPEEFTIGLPDLDNILEEFSIDRARQNDVPIESGKASSGPYGSLFQSAELRTPLLTSETSLTPKKRRQTEEKTILENMPPAAHGAGLETPTKRKRLEPRLVSVASPTSAVPLPFSHVPDIMDEQPCPIIEQFPEVPIMEQMPQMSLPQQMTIEEMRYEPIQKTVAPETTSDEKQLFGITWASRIHNVLQTNNKLTPLEICRELGEPVTRRHMGRIFAGLSAPFWCFYFFNVYL